MTTVSGGKIPYATFNADSTNFTQNNPFISLNSGDSLILWVVNKDNNAHEFEIRGITQSIQSIPANDSILLELKLNNAGAYMYRDPLNAPNNSYFGLSGLIIVKDHNHSSFVWELREHDSLFNVAISQGNSVNWANYNPKYFTINGYSNPNINSDPTARITGNVGDTIYIYIANCARSIHSLHFHGYHAEIIQSSAFPSHVGRSKDTFPVESQEVMVLRLVPDKEGEYPVHDHNLVAISGNNIYPNGMFLTMLISP